MPRPVDDGADALVTDSIAPLFSVADPSELDDSAHGYVDDLLRSWTSLPSSVDV